MHIFQISYTSSRIGGNIHIVRYVKQHDSILEDIMPEEISKERIDGLIKDYFSGPGLWRQMAKANPEIFSEIKDFMAGGGKRLRPLLFRYSYLGYAEKPLEDIYKIELALEFLHSFVVIHDDIIDRSELRRDTPSLHARFGGYLKKTAIPGTGIRGEDMAIVAGDIIYALAINIFQGVSAAPGIKEKAMSVLTETAFMTGYGEMLEMLETGTALEDVTEDTIYRIYDLKTAHYTFCCPLVLGAVFAGKNKETEKLNDAGLLLGRAYQIMDDINEISQGGKIPSDINDKTRTLLLKRAFETGTAKERESILAFLNSQDNSAERCMEIFSLLKKEDVLQYGLKEIMSLKSRAWESFEGLKMKEPCKTGLMKFIDDLIKEI